MKGLILIILIIASGFAAIYFLDEDVLRKGEEIPNVEIPESLDIEEGDLEIELSKSDTPSSSSGGGSDSAGGGSSEAMTNCETKQVSYSLKNFNEEVVCNTYSLGNCVDLEITCSVNVFNLDESTTGDFEIGFDLVEIATQEIFSSLSEEKSLGPKENDVFEGFFTVQDEAGLNEEGYDCDFTTLSIPNKAGC